MTDITELAQREKFEAWARSQKLGLSYGDCGYVFSSTEMAWRAWMTSSAELVEALEKAQQYAKERDEENQDLMLTIGRLRVEREGLEAIRAAAEKLVRCKGRYHSEQNYRALAALFGVNIPDLPPLEHENVHYADAAEMEIAALRQRIAELESRTVTVKLPQRLQPGADGWDDWYVHSDDEGEYLKFDDVLAMLTAAGIKVEAE
ncbi:ead/Ea22-like family protein [Klebsiella pneumoniae]|uniref:ead/Ea22-like family protein n=1 Tax=Klebsiella pneumoniae TaxID=573 RepID=UPI000F51A069|nr:ead/Ea22-like family protein [Klebsiella pneumoniae]